MTNITVPSDLLNETIEYIELAIDRMESLIGFQENYYTTNRKLSNTLVTTYKGELVVLKQHIKEIESYL